MQSQQVKEAVNGLGSGGGVMALFVDVAGEVERYQGMNAHLQSVVSDLRYELSTAKNRIMVLREDRERLEEIIEEYGTRAQKELLEKERKIWAKA